MKHHLIAINRDSQFMETSLVNIHAILSKISMLRLCGDSNQLFIEQPLVICLSLYIFIYLQYLCAYAFAENENGKIICTAQILNVFLISSEYSYFFKLILNLLFLQALKVPKKVTSFNLYVNIRNFVCYIGEDADILIGLYDTKSGQFIRCV